MFFAISTLILIFCLILQTSFLARWPWYGVIPDLNLIVVTCFSWKAGPLMGTTFGFTAGILQDFMSLKSLGASSLCKTCVGFITGNFRGNNSTFAPLLLLIINTLINEGIYLLFYFALGTQKALPPNILFKVCMQIFLNLLFTPLFLLIFSKLGRLFMPRQILI